MMLGPYALSFMYMKTGKGSSCPVVSWEEELRHGRNVRLPLRGDPVLCSYPHSPDVQTQARHRPSVSFRTH